MVTVNVLYDVGSKDEDPNKTGFAHLFEHLMFGGTPEIPDYDSIAQEAGASNNAFTSNDLTNYYITLPSVNIETGLMLEADRMKGLLFSEESLEVQRKVVIEEFKQRYLNKPYGDIWLELSPLAYKKHPYSWPTIGKKIAHIEEATIADVKAFFKKHYSPSNAILSIAGNIDLAQCKEMIEKWFGPIPAGNKYERHLEQEPVQTEKRVLTLDRAVPQSSINKVFHMPRRVDFDYHTGDLISDLLGRGISSWFYSELVKEQKLFTEIHCAVTGNTDPGLFSISGMISPEVSFDEAEEALDKILEDLSTDKVDQDLIDSLLNKIETSYLFNEINHSNVAFNLAHFELLGNIDLINDEMQNYRALTVADVARFASTFLSKEKASVLYYNANVNSNDSSGN
jgi:predicted Zn-dependent peptidase